MERSHISGLSNPENRRVWNRIVLLAQHCYKKADRSSSEKRKKAAHDLRLERIRASAMSVLKEVPRSATAIQIEITRVADHQ